MLTYVYYRCYCFFEKTGLAFDPHTYAVGIPTFVSVFMVSLGYYLGVKAQLVPMVDLNFFIYAILFFGIYFLIDKFYDGRIKKYKLKWDIENRRARLIKGILILCMGIGCFVGIFLLADAFRALNSH